MRHLYAILIVHFAIIGATFAQQNGCTDPLAANYNPVATDNDGTCIYAALSVAPSSSVNLPLTVSETSGLMKFSTTFFTHNDSSDTNLYAIDSVTAAVTATHVLPNVSNQDWEDIAQDENFIYVGDFGNNAQGNRQNLRILRIAKTSFPGIEPVIDTIAFSYENQTDFSSLANNTTDFDCEAMVASTDFLYLFTKQWTANATTVYKVPKLAGTHTALVVATFDVDGLITGATYLQNRRLLVLSGYSNFVSPFVYLFYDFYGDNFFSANTRKISIPLQFHQMEAISTRDGLHYWMTNERLVQAPFVNVPPKLHMLDLTPQLSYYINNVGLDTNDFLGDRPFAAFPNPTDQTLTIRLRIELLGAPFMLFNQAGQNVLQGTLESLTQRIDVSAVSAGVYYLQVGTNRNHRVNVAIE